MTNLAYQCCYCKDKKYVNTKSRMRTHIYKYHLPLEQAPFYCGLCLFRCENQRDLQRHRISYTLHRQRVKDYSKSNPNFSDVSYLHHSSRPYQLSDKDFVCLNVPYIGQPRKVNNKVQYVPTPIVQLQAARSATVTMDDNKTLVSTSPSTTRSVQVSAGENIATSSISSVSSTLPLNAPVITVSPALCDPGATDQEDWMTSQPILSMPYLDDLLDHLNQSPASTFANLPSSTALLPVSTDVTLVKPVTTSSVLMSNSLPTVDVPPTLPTNTTSSSTTTVSSSLTINTTSASKGTDITTSATKTITSVVMPTVDNTKEEEDHFHFDLEATCSPIPSSPASVSSSSSSSDSSSSCTSHGDIMEKLNTVITALQKQDQTIKRLENTVKELERTVSHQTELLKSRNNRQDKENQRRYRDRSPLQARRYR